MKYLFVFLLMGLVSCGDASGDEKSIVVVNGKNVSTIKIGNLEIMTEDLGKMDWLEAKQACVDLGDGWRLPTKDELNILYENKDEIGGFANYSYWSSTGYGNGDAWGQDFSKGGQYNGGRRGYLYVRSVRAF